VGGRGRAAGVAHRHRGGRPEQLDLLLELQATDSRIRRLEHQLDDLPEQQQLDACLARVEQLEQDHADTRVQLDRAGAAQRQLERETEVLTQRRDAERARLYDGSVANAREMKAVEAEIETTERRISEQEDLLLEVLEKVEQLEASVAALQDAADAERQRIARARPVARDLAVALPPAFGDWDESTVVEVCRGLEAQAGVGMERRHALRLDRRGQRGGVRRGQPRRRPHGGGEGWRTWVTVANPSSRPAEVRLTQRVGLREGEEVAVALWPGTTDAVRTGLPGFLYGWLPLTGSLLLAGLLIAGGMRLYRVGWAVAGLALALVGATFFAV
jgi:hypothetical protein